jgi:hypothetical protein
MCLEDSGRIFMKSSRDTTALMNRKDWVKGNLFPSLTSGSIGGATVGCCCGFLLAPPHHFAETVFGSILAGATIGFVIAWIGAAIVGVCHFLFNR